MYVHTYIHISLYYSLIFPVVRFVAERIVLCEIRVSRCVEEFGGGLKVCDTVQQFGCA